MIVQLAAAGPVIYLKRQLSNAIDSFSDNDFNVNLSFIQQIGQLPLSGKRFFQACVFCSIFKACNYLWCKESFGIASDHQVLL